MPSDPIHDELGKSALIDLLLTSIWVAWLGVAKGNARSVVPAFYK
ncbi:hypothetical protein [Mesorhizobium sp. M0118]